MFVLKPVVVMIGVKIVPDAARHCVIIMRGVVMACPGLCLRSLGRFTAVAALRNASAKSRVVRA